MIVKRLSLWMTGIYCRIYPAHTASATYLSKLHKYAGLKTCVAHLGALGVLELISLWRFKRLVSQIKQPQFEKLMESLFYSQTYFFRLFAYGIKSHALVALESELA